MHNNDTTKLNVSLEPHLITTLEPLGPLLPTDLASELSTYPSKDADLIPYSLLLAISQWSRTSAGADKLKSHVPPLEPSSFTMISLLAGVKTSPERNLGSYTPPKTAEELASQQMSDRRAVTTIINALLSIVGAGFTTWWAADKLHWKDEWRVLLALGASFVVAAAEGGLFLIWQSHQSTDNSQRKSRRKVTTARHKKIDGDPIEKQEIIQVEVVTEQRPTASNQLRQR